MPKKKKIEAKGFNPIYSLQSGLESTILGSERFVHFMKTYWGSIILVLMLFIVVLISTSHTRSIYREKEAAERRLKSVEAEFNNSKEAFRRATLSSFIKEEVERRSLKVEQSNKLPIAIE